MPDYNPVFNPQGALSALATDPMLRQMMERQQTGFEQSQEQLGRVRSASEAATEASEMEPLAAAALAAGKSPMTGGGFGQLLANIGGTYAATKAAQAQKALEREQSVLKDIGTAAAGGMGAGANTAMLQSALNPFHFSKNGMVQSKRTGQMISAPMLLEEARKYQASRQKTLEESGQAGAAEIAKAQTLQMYPELEEVLDGTLPTLFGGTGVTSQAASTKTDEQPSAVLAPGTDVKTMLKQLDRSQKQFEAAGDFEKAAEALKAKQAITKKLSFGKYEETPSAAEAAGLRPTTPAPTPTAPAQPLSKAELGREETAAKETAKDLVDYEKQLTASNDSANTMLRNIGHLAEEAKSANFGAGAGAKTQALKWADTLGVTLDPADAKAMNANQIIGKIALQLATIGAKNISSRPTQMEFQKLLEEGVPSTGMTKDAFLKVLALFKETAQTEQGQLSEFMKFKHSMPKGTVSSGDFSDYWALRKDPRYFSLSINDILDTMKERKMTFNQVISKLRERK